MYPVQNNLVWCTSTKIDTMSKNIPMIIIKTNTNILIGVLTLMSNEMTLLMFFYAVQTILPATHNVLFSLFSLNRFRLKFVTSVRLFFCLSSLAILKRCGIETFAQRAYS